MCVPRSVYGRNYDIYERLRQRKRHFTVVYDHRDVRPGIESSLKKGKYILRVIDKSDLFHISHAIDYEQKVEVYLQKTDAYIELTNYPL
jgi:hypothetical protein